MKRAKYKSTMVIYPIGKEYPILVQQLSSLDVKYINIEQSFNQAMEEGRYEYFYFEILNISKETSVELYRRANDRKAWRESRFNKFKWYAHCRGKYMDYNYRKDSDGKRYIDVNTYKNYR